MMRCRKKRGLLRRHVQGDGAPEFIYWMQRARKVLLRKSLEFRAALAKLKDECVNKNTRRMLTAVQVLQKQTPQVKLAEIWSVEEE